MFWPQTSSSSSFSRSNLRLAIEGDRRLPTPIFPNDDTNLAVISPSLILILTSHPHPHPHPPFPSPRKIHPKDEKISAKRFQPRTCSSRPVSPAGLLHTLKIPTTLACSGISRLPAPLAYPQSIATITWNRILLRPPTSFPCKNE